jgi:hypothetical protein
MTRCPICEREAKHIPPTGDADIFDCPSHGVFKVAGTLTALPKFKGLQYRIGNGRSVLRGLGRGQEIGH